MISMSQMLIGIDVNLKSRHLQLMEVDMEELITFSISNERYEAGILLK